MTVALHDAVLLTEYLKPSEELSDLHDWEAIRYKLQDWYWKRKHLAGVVNILSIALYDLFGADGKPSFFAPCVTPLILAILQRQTKICQSCGKDVSATLSLGAIALPVP